MKIQRGWFIGLLSVVLVIGYACQDLPVEPDSSVQEQAIHSQKFESHGSMSTERDRRNFRASLKGEEEVPPVETNAQGQAIFQVNRDGDSIDYKLIVANIENVTQAHIHLGPAGVNGPVVVWLYPAGPPAELIPGRFQGVLAEGTIKAANFVGELAGQELDALIELMETEEVYVNVHTLQNPPGEIRGQIK
jgi:hypothetical protein